MTLRVPGVQNDSIHRCLCQGPVPLVIDAEHS